jgi:hypothetical protein
MLAAVSIIGCWLTAMNQLDRAFRCDWQFPYNGATQFGQKVPGLATPDGGRVY